MNGPPLPARRTFYADGHAAEHLCDHVLTRPEAHDWAVVLPGYCDMVDPTDDAGLRRIAASLFPGPASAEAQELLGLYAAVILQNLEDALQLGFWWEQRQGKYQEWFGLGLDGIYVIWDREVIKTGYFPGSVSHEPAGAVRPRTENPLPRRDPRKRLPPPAPDSPRRRYELFKLSYYCAGKNYGVAHEAARVQQAGGNVFVDRINPPKKTKWERWVAARPDATA